MKQREKQNGANLKTPISSDEHPQTRLPEPPNSTLNRRKPEEPPVGRLAFFSLPNWNYLYMAFVIFFLFLSASASCPVPLPSPYAVCPTFFSVVIEHPDKNNFREKWFIWLTVGKPRREPEAARAG